MTNRLYYRVSPKSEWTLMFTATDGTLLSKIVVKLKAKYKEYQFIIK